MLRTLFPLNQLQEDLRVDETTGSWRHEKRENRLQGRQRLVKCMVSLSKQFQKLAKLLNMTKSSLVPKLYPKPQGPPPLPKQTKTTSSLHPKKARSPSQLFGSSTQPGGLPPWGLPDCWKAPKGILQPFASSLWVAEGSFKG